MSEFVKLIEDSPMGYVEKLKNAVELKIVRNMSRNMIRELSSIYKNYNPDFDEKMISCMSCPSSVLRFMVMVGEAYLNEKSNILEAVPAVEEEEFFGIPVYSPTDSTNSVEYIEKPEELPIDKEVITTSVSTKKKPSVK